MVTRTFNIPQPIISNPDCEYFAIRYRKIQPVIGAWATIPNITVNDFSIQMDYNSVYEIEATHHCCDGNDSEPTTVTFNTSTNNATVYVCMTETFVSDTCAITPGNCRNCEVVKSYKFKFFQNSNGTTPLNLQNGNLKLKVQETVNGVANPPFEIQLNSGISEYNYGNLATYQEICGGGATSQIINRSLTLLDGTFEQFPYNIISCVSNSSTLTQTSNTSTGQGGIRTQIFKVGNDILPGNKFQLGVYSVVKTVTAVQGDTPTSIAQKLANAINNTTANQWNQFGSAPTNANGFPPSASSLGSNVEIRLNHQNSFFGAAYEN